MNASLLPMASLVFRRLLVAAVLMLIGLIVGAACVVLPIATPFVCVALAGGLLLWLMPDLRVVPVTLMRRTFYALLFANLCIPGYFTIIIPGLPWLSLRRLALFAFLMPCIIALCGSSHCRSKAASLLRAHTFLFGCFLVYLGMMVVSTILSVQVSTSINSTTNFVMGLLLPFLGVLVFLDDRTDVIRIMKFLVYCVFLDLIIGAVEFYLRKPFLIYLMPPSMRDQILAANPVYYTLFQGQGIRNGLYRAASTFNVSLSWGEMGAVLAPVAMHFLAHGTSRKERAFGACGFVAAFASIVLSGARGAYVGFLGGMVVYAIAWALRLQRRNPASLAGLNAITLLGMASVTTFLAVLFVGPVRSYVLGSGSTSSSTQARWDEWALAKPRILASPIWGYGPGTSGDVIGYHPFGSVSATVDSYIMTVLVDNGFIGFAALTLLVAGALSIALRRYLTSVDDGTSHGNALASALVAFMIYRITLSQSENMLTIFSILALIILSFARPKYTRAYGRGLKIRSSLYVFSANGVARQPNIS